MTVINTNPDDPTTSLTIQCSNKKCPSPELKYRIATVDKDTSHNVFCPNCDRTDDDEKVTVVAVRL